MTTKGKKKQTRKQRIASMKNLAKAQKALRAKGKTKTKKPRTASRSTSKPKPKAKPKKTAMTKSKSKAATKAKRPAMRAAPKVPRGVRPAGRSTPRRPAGSKQTPAQYRASLRNLAKARSARKRASKRHPVKPHSYPVGSKTVRVPKHLSWEGREASKRGKQTPAQRRASLANLRKARAAQKHGHGGHGARETARASKGQTPAQRRASLRNLAKARAARKKAAKRHNVRGYSYNRKAGTRNVPGHLSWETAGYYENPFTGVELFVGGFSGLVWFMLTDFVDRVIATHDLTDKGTKDAAGHELYADNPPTSGDYAGVFNPTAICAPMNVWRWLAGGAMIVVPLAIGHFVPDPTAKSVFHGAFFGSTMRIGGKALIDLVAYGTMWTPFGQRLYDGEMRAQLLASSDQSDLASLPSAGLGNPGCECEACKVGVGACQAGAGMGWPSNVREVAPQMSDGGQPPAPPAPPPQAPQSEPGASEPGYLAGPIAALPARNPFVWGVRDREEEKAA